MIIPYNYDDPEKNKSLVGGSSAVASKIKPFDYDAKQNLIDSLIKKYNLPGESSIGQAPEPVVPGGFIGRAAKAAFDTANDTVNDSVTRIEELFSTIQAHPERDEALHLMSKPDGTIDYSVPTFQTRYMTPEQRKQYYDDLEKKGSGLSEGVAAGKAILGVTNLVFLPVTTQLEAAKQVPVLKYPAEGASWVFGKLGQLGSYTLGKGVDYLPVTQDTKDQIKPLAQEVGAFVAQLVGLKVGFKVAESGLGGIKPGLKLSIEKEFKGEDGKKYVTTKEKGTMLKDDYIKETEQSGLYKKLPLSENAKENLSTGVQTTVGLSMTPFSTAFGIASAKLTEKIHQRVMDDIEINKKEQQKIVDEIKAEMPDVLSKMKIDTIDQTTKKLNDFEATAAKSQAETTRLLEEKRLSETSAAQMKPEDINIVRDRVTKFKPADERDTAMLEKVREELLAHEETGVLPRGGKAVDQFISRLNQMRTEEAAKKQAKEYVAKQKEGALPLTSMTVYSTEFLDPKRISNFQKSFTVKDLPNKVTVYKGGGEMKDGSYVTFDKEYAKTFGKVKEYQVNKKDLMVDKKGDLFIKDKKATAPTPSKKNITNSDQSRVYERLKEEHPEILKDDASYEAIKLKDDAEKAVELVAKDKDEAYRQAMTGESSGKGPTSTAVNIALAEVALREGNYELYNQLVKTRSFAQTRRGQEIVAEKGSVSDNSTGKYVKQLINAKMEQLGKSYLGDLKETLKKSTNVKKALEITKAEVDKIKKRSDMKNMDLKEAQSFLDKLACA